MINFQKYQGTGNDFILIDNREEQFPVSEELVLGMCDRRFGVGADGLILLQNKEGYDFEMVYYNSDGRVSSMCGNGGRCLAAFAHKLGIVADRCRFLAVDGPHEAILKSDDWVALSMQDVATTECGDRYYVLDTGSPHYVVFVKDVSGVNVVKTGQTIRYSDPYRKEGINVNFVEIEPDGLQVATYERGVEDETLSCGTGVTASAIAFGLHKKLEGPQVVPIQTKGGRLEVSFHLNEDGSFSDVWLAGPAELVFEGRYVKK